MEAYQQRVVNEKSELDEKLGKLKVFLTSSTFGTLNDAERYRLTEQSKAMETYSEILGRRIAAF